MKALAIALAVFILRNPLALATPVDPKCEAFPTQRADVNTDIDSAIGERLRSLPAPWIPPYQFNRVMQKMRRDLQPVRKVAETILANERDYIAGNASRNEVIEKSQSTREALGQLANRILAKSKLDMSDRRQLEAIRLLRDRTRRVETQSPEELAKVVTPKEEEASAQEPRSKRSKRRDRKSDPPSQDDGADPRDSSERSGDDEKSRSEEQAQSSKSDAAADESTQSNNQQPRKPRNRNQKRDLESKPSEPRDDHPDSAPCKQDELSNEPRDNEDPQSSKDNKSSAPSEQRDQSPKKSTKTDAKPDANSPSESSREPSNSSDDRKDSAAKTESSQGKQNQNQSKPPAPRQQKPSKPAESQKAADESDSGDPKDKDDKAAPSEKNSSEQDGESSSSQDQKSTDGKPSPSKEPAESGDAQSSNGEKTSSSGDQSSPNPEQQSADGKSFQGEGRDASDGKPSANGQAASKAESSPGDGEPRSGETSKGASEKKSGSKSSEGEVSESAGEGSEASEGKSSAQSKTAGDSQSSGKQEQSNADGVSNSGSMDEGGDGVSKGSGPEQQPLTDRLQEFFKNLLQERAAKDDRPKNKKSELEKPRTDPTEAAKKWDEIQRSKPSPVTRDKSESHPLSQSKQQKADDKRKPLSQLEDARQTELLLKLIRRLSAQALRNYQSSGSFAGGLGELQTTLASISAEIHRSDALRQAVSELRSVREGLESFQVEYRTLEQLGLSLVRTLEGAPADSLRKLNYLNELFTALEKRTQLTHDEQRTLDLVRRLLQIVSSNEEASDKDFAEAFMSQLMGPLSRKMIKDQFRSEAMPDGYDFAAMAKAFRNGEYNDLLVQSALKPYMNMLLNTSMKPKDRKDPNGPTVVMSEQEPTLEQAQDLSNFHAFYRDGSPTDVDLLKYLSGDMLEWIHRDEVTKADPKTLYPKKITYILYDVSSSMNENSKFVLTTAMILAYLDRSQIEVRAGKAEHIVYTEAFNEIPHEPERIGSLAQAQEVFERIRKQPLTAAGSTDITGAIVDVYKRIAKHQNEGGELGRANILLLTDAEDTIRFEQIEEARKKISPDLQIRFNAITLGKLKGDIQKLTEYSGGEGQGKLGDVGQRHIDFAQIQELLNQDLRIDVIKKSVAAFRSGDKQQLANSALIDLKNKLVLLESNRSAKDASKLSLYSRLERLLQTRGPEEEDPALTLPIQHFRRLASARTTIGWTRAERLEALWGYLGDLAQAIGSDPETVANSLSEAQRAWLRR